MTSLPRLPRAVAVSLALVANLFAASVPVVHALAHEHVAEHHPVGLATSASQVEHEHDAVHPASLHDDLIVGKQRSIDVWYAPLAEAPTLVVFGEPDVPSHRPVPRLSSRAPPPGDPARAPPPV